MKRFFEPEKLQNAFLLSALALAFITAAGLIFSIYRILVRPHLYETVSFAAKPVKFIFFILLLLNWNFLFPRTGKLSNLAKILLAIMAFSLFRPVLAVMANSLFTPIFTAWAILNTVIYFAVMAISGYFLYFIRKNDMDHPAKAGLFCFMLTPLLSLLLLPTILILPVNEQAYAHVAYLMSYLYPILVLLSSLLLGEAMLKQQKRKIREVRGWLMASGLSLFAIFMLVINGSLREFK